MQRMLRLIVVWLCGIVGLVGLSGAATITLPDADGFDTSGTPPPGWRVVAGSGVWSADGVQCTAGKVDYTACTLVRGGAADAFSYNSNYPLSFSVDIQPALSSSEARVGFGFLMPSTAYLFANGGWGYALAIKLSGANMSLDLVRDQQQWDGGRTVVGSAVLSKATYNNAMHNYKVIVTYQDTKTATFDVYVDDELGFSYTDTAFLPLELSYSTYFVQLFNHQWPSSGPTYFDNWLVEQITPEPTVDNATGASEVGSDSARVHGTLRKVGSAPPLGASTGVQVTRDRHTTAGANHSS